VLLGDAPPLIKLLLMWLAAGNQPLLMANARLFRAVARRG
jgi:hypothetical protein